MITNWSHSRRRSRSVVTRLRFISPSCLACSVCDGGLKEGSRCRGLFIFLPRLRASRVYGEPEFSEFPLDFVFQFPPFFSGATGVRFMENLQTEVLELEFQEYSRGREVISETDFARILLRYTSFHSNQYGAPLGPGPFLPIYVLIFFFIIY